MRIICRVPASGDLSAGGRGTGSLDAGRLGRWDEPDVAGRWWKRCGSMCWARRSCTATMCRYRCWNRQRQDEDGAIVDLRRDNRPAGSDAPAAVSFAYSPDRKGEHPARQRADYVGILPAMVTQGSSSFMKRAASWRRPAGPIIWTMELSGANAVSADRPMLGMGASERALQIRRHKLSRNTSSFGDGRHLRGAAGSSPARFQKASSTSRFI